MPAQVVEQYSKIQNQKMILTESDLSLARELLKS
jgi:hypothetical protein